MTTRVSANAEYMTKNESREVAGSIPKPESET